MLFFNICVTQKKLATFFKFWPIFRHLPTPCLWIFLNKIPAKQFKIIKYQCTLVTLNHWDCFGWSLFRSTV